MDRRRLDGGDGVEEDSGLFRLLWPRSMVRINTNKNKILQCTRCRPFNDLYFTVRGQTPHLLLLSLVFEGLRQIRTQRWQFLSCKL